MQFSVKIFIRSFLFLILFLLISCKEDTVTPTPPDPCAGKHPVSADFDMYEGVGTTYRRAKESGDTMHYSAYLSLNAKDNYDEYEWRLEGDTSIYRTKNTTIRFEEEIGTIWVRLIVKSKPDTACFPNDDGIDTVIKKITVGFVGNSGIIGRFKGANLDAPLDSFEIQILCHKHNPYYYTIQLQNFPRGKYDTCYDKYSSQWDLRIYYNAIYITHRATLPLPQGWLVYDPKTNKLRIDYELDDPGNPDPAARKGYIYEGIRIGDNK